jgi:hypothetical protein
MDVVERTKPAGAPAGWAVVGALWMVAILGIASIGVFIALVAIIATGVASHFYGRDGLLALPVAAAVSQVFGGVSLFGVGLRRSQTNSQAHKLTYYADHGNAQLCGKDADPPNAKQVREIG